MAEVEAADMPHPADIAPWEAPRGATDLPAGKYITQRPGRRLRVPRHRDRITRARRRPALRTARNDIQRPQTPETAQGPDSTVRRTLRAEI